MGIGVKDSLSYALIDQNTFYQNNYSVACFEKNWGVGGGSANVINSILSQSKISPGFKDNLSTLNITYSLSDTEQLSGTGNINEDPLFKNPLNMDFELEESSPCINTGSPNSPMDPDGSIADMGAYFTYLQSSGTGVIINEINYRSHPNYDAGDWIEVYNNTFSDIDMSGWIFKDKNDEHIYHFPEGFFLAKDSYVVICNELDSFKTQYPAIWNCRGSFDFGLNNNDEIVRLFDAKMNLIDYVEYTNQDPWPTEPDGEGYTLQLKNPNLDNSFAENWTASSGFLGTPGISNVESIIPYFGKDRTLQIFPNPSTGFIQVSFKNSHSDDITIEVINLYGQTIFSNEFICNTSEFFQLIDLRDLQHGLYVMKVLIGDEVQTEKIILQ